MILALALKTESPSAFQYVVTRRAGGVYSIVLRLTNFNELAMITYHGGTAVTHMFSPSLTHDEWYDVVMGYDDTTRERWLYLNGDLQESTVAPDDWDNGADPQWYMATNYILTQFFTGEIAMPFFDLEATPTQDQTQALAYARKMYLGV